MYKMASERYDSDGDRIPGPPPDEGPRRSSFSQLRKLIANQFDEKIKDPNHHLIIMMILMKMLLKLH